MNKQAQEAMMKALFDDTNDSNEEESGKPFGEPLAHEGPWRDGVL
jgi:hypothetical protein